MVHVRDKKKLNTQNKRVLEDNNIVEKEKTSSTAVYKIYTNRKLVSGGFHREKLTFVQLVQIVQKV